MPWTPKDTATSVEAPPADATGGWTRLVLAASGTFTLTAAAVLVVGSASDGPVPPTAGATDLRVATPAAGPPIVPAAEMSAPATSGVLPSTTPPMPPRPSPVAATRTGDADRTSTARAARPATRSGSGSGSGSGSDGDVRAAAARVARAPAEKEQAPGKSSDQGKKDKGKEKGKKGKGGGNGGRGR